MSQISRIALLALVVASSAARAEDPKPADGKETVGVTITGQNVDFGNLHLLVMPLGVNLSKQTSVPLEVSAHWEPLKNVGLRAHAELPYFGIDGNETDTQWLKLELAGNFYRVADEIETEEVVLTYDVDKKTYIVPGGTVTETSTSKQSVKVPSLNRNWQGFGGGVLVWTGLGEIDAGGRFEEKVHGTHVTVFGGIAALNAMGLAVDVEGFGQYSMNRWLAGGFDIFFDVLRSYDRDPATQPGRFGGRLWIDSIAGRTIGAGGRLELGYLPGGAGFYINFAVGGGLNTTVPGLSG